LTSAKSKPRSPKEPSVMRKTVLADGPLRAIRWHASSTMFRLLVLRRRLLVRRMDPAVLFTCLLVATSVTPGTPVTRQVWEAIKDIKYKGKTPHQDGNCRRKCSQRMCFTTRLPALRYSTIRSIVKQYAVLLSNTQYLLLQ